ncbi:MAG: TraB/GumN family protein, partial [Anaerolineae bacterium]
MTDPTDTLSDHSETSADSLPAQAGASGQPVREVQRDGVRYTLLGTAHVSRASVDAVRDMAGSGVYDTVAVELCATRLEALDGKKSWQNLDLFQIIRQGKASLVMANLALGGYQRRIADQFGIEPGAELKAAAEAARAGQLRLQLVDRDLATTLRRTYRAVPWYKRFYLTTGLVMSSFSSEELDEEAVEKLKEGDILESTFTEFAEQSPELYEALIGERDRYMAARLRIENLGRDNARVLVVVGAGHLDGLARYLAEDQQNPDRVSEELAQVPPGARWPRYIPWAITALVVSGFIYGFSRSPELGWQLVMIWVLINGGLAALGAACA